jgi:hypothetical protein
MLKAEGKLSDADIVNSIEIQVPVFHKLLDTRLVGGKWKQCHHEAMGMTEEGIGHGPLYVSNKQSDGQMELYLASPKNERHTISDPSEKVPWFSAIQGNFLHAKAVINMTVEGGGGNGHFSVLTLTGQEIHLTYNADHSIADVKSLIREATGFPEDEQRLIYEGKQLEDIKKLIDYDIVAGAKLHLVLRLRGGMYHAASSRDDWLELMVTSIPIEVFERNEETGEVLTEVLWLRPDMTVADVKEQILGNTGGGAADEPDDALDVDDGSGLSVSEDIAVVDAMNTSQPAGELGGQLS